MSMEGFKKLMKGGVVMAIETHKPNLKPARYFVCFLDALGTRDCLFSGIDIANPQVTPKKLLEIGQHAIATHEFLSGISAEISLVKENPIEYVEKTCLGVNIPDGIMSRYKEEALSISCGFQQFSDTTLLYVRDSRDDGQVGLFALFLFQCLMLSVSLSLIKAMANGCFYRGSLAYGTGWELDENCLFGPVVQKAYEIEEQAAKWPRIVITDAMEKQLRQMAEGVSSNACPAKMICQDPDGKLSLDYWSVGAVENYLKVMNKDELLRLAEAGYNHAVEQQMHFSAKMCADDPNGKLFLRYGALLSYLDDRMIARGLFKPVKKEGIK